MATCKGLKKDGSACGMRPPAGEEFCLNHGGKKPEKKAAEEKKPAAKKDEGEKTAGKAAPASRGASKGDGWGIAAGVVVGCAIAAAIVYAARRFIAHLPTGGAQQPAQAGSGGGSHLMVLG